jgi:hypothetical protein
MVTITETNPLDQVLHCKARETIGSHASTTMKADFALEPGEQKGREIATNLKNDRF